MAMATPVESFTVNKKKNTTQNNVQKKMEKINKKKKKTLNERSFCIYLFTLNTQECQTYLLKVISKCIKYGTASNFLERELIHTN